MAIRKAASPGLREHAAELARAAADPPRLIVVSGECEFLRAAAVAALTAAWRERHAAGDAVTIRTGAGEKGRGTEDVVRELAGSSLFAGEKLVIARGAEKMLFPRRAAADENAPAGKAGEREKAFLDRLENPPAGVWVLLETSELPKNRIAGKRLAAAAAVIPCPEPAQREVPGWLAGRAKELGCRLDDEAADMLLRAHGTDIAVLAGELEKLALYAGGAGGTKDIGGEMVATFLTGTEAYDVFNFTNAVEARDLGAAVGFARRITMQGGRDQRGKREDGEKTAHRVLSMLAGTIRGLLLARVAMAARLPAAEFAVEEKTSPWRAEKMYEAAGRFTPRELREMLARAAETLRGSHDTGGDVLLALESIAARTARGARGGEEKDGRRQNHARALSR